jgi:AhpD family alkylhydroperoxidase
MTPRIDLYRPWPAGYKAMLALEAAVADSGFDPCLLELVKVRVSQINGCAYCLDMHTKDARAHGESEQRLYALSAWRDAPFFTERERAALDLAEAVTHVEVPDAVVDQARRHFDDAELAQLVFAVTVINAWNRLSIAGKPKVGDYVSKVGA